jgi:RND family efflux transporter MFP subunit
MAGDPKRPGKSETPHCMTYSLLLCGSQRGFAAWLLPLATMIAVSLCGCRQQTAGPPTLPPANVTVAKAVEKEVVNYQEYTGNTAAVSSVDIRARVSGYLNKVSFSEGAIVKAGDLLFVIDPRPYQAALDQAQANVEQAKAQLALADSNYKRSEKLFQTNVIDAQSYETQLENRDQANATLLGNQAALETAKLNFEFTQIRSPIDGQTSTYNYTIGNLITGGDTSSSGVLTTVVSIDPVYVYINVDERGLLIYQEMVRTGKIILPEGGKTPIEMQLANENDFPHKGFVDFVDNQVDPNTGTIRVRGVFANKDRTLRPGLFAQVRIPASSKYKSLLISDLCVAYDQGQPIVYAVGTDNKATEKSVTLGAMYDGLREVKDGITSEDRIVVNGVVRLRPGVPVVPKEGNMADFAGTVRRQISMAMPVPSPGDKANPQSAGRAVGSPSAEGQR